MYPITVIILVQKLGLEYSGILQLRNNAYIPVLKVQFLTV